MFFRTERSRHGYSNYRHICTSTYTFFSEKYVRSIPAWADQKKESLTSGPRPDQIAQSLGPVRHMLENHRDNLLAFVGVLDERFAEIAARFNVPLFLVHAICELQNLDENLPRYWQQQARLRKKLRDKFDRITAKFGWIMMMPRLFQPFS